MSGVQRLSLNFGAVVTTDDELLASIVPGQVVTPDLVYSLAIDATSEVTQYPVDEGANVTDHVRPKPITIRIDALLTDSGLDPAKADTEAPEGTSEATFKQLDDQRLAGALLTLHTDQKDFANMVITSLSRTQDKSLTRAVRFTCTLQEIRIVQTLVKALEQPKIKKAAPKQDTGTQQGTDASDENRSHLHQWFGHKALPLGDET